ncbi:MAG TPA: choice-of-anchor D domain-containing protein, partial [Thermoanaerobaculia bacterium]
MGTLRRAFAVCGPLLVFAVSGAYAAPAAPPTPAATPSDLNFGAHDVGTRTAPVPLRIDNPTASELVFTPQPVPLEFAVERRDCRDPVPAHGSCTVTVRFSPVQAAPSAATLHIAYRDTADGKKVVGEFAVSLAGVGFASQITVSPPRLFFPSGGEARQTIVVASTGKDDITVQAVVASGDFAVDAPQMPYTLKVGTPLLLAVRHLGSGAGAGSVAILSNANVNPQVVPLEAEGFWPRRWCGWPFGGLLVAGFLCLVYWLAMVAVRWEQVAMDTRGKLRGEIAAVRAELATYPSQDPVTPVVTGLLDTAADLLDGPRHRSGQWFLNILFWSRGQEIAGWGYVHEAQVRMVPLLDAETVGTRLEEAERTLRLCGEAACVQLADLIQKESASAPPATPDRRKALLAEALRALYGREDRTFSGFVSWQNKTSWLVGCGLSAIFALTGFFPNQAVLLVVGGAGGLISRLSRSLDRQDVPTDYGAAWTTLFLSPVAGAVGAWAGIMVAGLAANANVLGQIFHVDWNHPDDVTTLGIALL